MTRRAIGRSLVAIACLVVASDASLCRVHTSSSLSAYDAGSTSSSASDPALSSSSTVLLEESISTTLIHSSAFTGTSSTTSISSDDADSTTSVPLTSPIDASVTSILGPTDATNTEIIDTTSIEIIDTTTTEITDTTTPATETIAAATSDATTDMATATTAPAAVPTFLSNTGFDDVAQGTTPWRMGIIPATIDDSFFHDGLASLKISLGPLNLRDVRGFWQSLDTSILEPDVDYTLSAFIYSKAIGSANSQISCVAAKLGCFNDNEQMASEEFSLGGNYNEWYRISTTVQFSQDQINTGDVRVLISYHSGGYNGGSCWFDTVNFQKALVGQ